jgi:hypothetical protein
VSAQWAIFENFQGIKIQNPILMGGIFSEKYGQLFKQRKGSFSKLSFSTNWPKIGRL